MFNRVSAIVLFVQDFEKCLTFYRDKLGLQIVQLESDFAAFKMDNQDFAIQGLEASAGMVNLTMDAFEPQTGKVDRVLLCTRVDNVDEAYNMLKAKGVEFTGPPEDKPWGIRVAYFTDPEGNIWEIAHPLADTRQ